MLKISKKAVWMLTIMMSAILKLMIVGIAEW
jgi:hypothetical protein